MFMWSFCRYFSVHSTLVTAYGYVDISSDPAIYGTGLSHLFIPQVSILIFKGDIFQLHLTLSLNILLKHG